MAGPLYFKWTLKGRVPSYQGGDPIPYRKWTPRVADPMPCARGWHACRWEDTVYHISDELWIVELNGVIVEGDDKVAAERLRIVRKVSAIDDRTLRLFAADCAEDVLHLFEEEYPNDDRPRKAIEAARQFANGDIAAAARSAARSAAWSAAGLAWSAARSAADSAADSAARSAARSAADSAAWSAARSAARSAVRSAQTQRLLVDYAHLDPADFAHRSAA